MFKFLSGLAQSAVKLLTTSSSNQEDNTSEYDSSHEVLKVYAERYLSIQRTAMMYDKESWKVIEDVTRKAREMIRDLCPYQEIAETLEGSPDIAQSINLRDHSGYNLLQHGIIANRPCVVQMLLKKGADLNFPMCGRPLHLAVKLGHDEIVKILLDFGADPDVVSAVCYPKQHLVSKTVFISGPEVWSATCVNDIYTPNAPYSYDFDFPLYYAIASDNVWLVELFMQQGITKLICRDSPLHLACSLTSYHSMKYFVEHFPKDLHVKNDLGVLPVESAIQGGKRFLECLILNGASVQSISRYGETLLHLLFKESVSNEELAESTEYLLNCGLALEINSMDCNGNTPLHSLLRRLQTHPPLCSTSYLENFTSDEMQFIDSLRHLLRAGADPNLCCSKTGDSSLHYLSRVPNVTTYPNRFYSFRLVHHMLDMLLQHGTKHCIVNNAQSSVLGLFVINGSSILFARSAPSGMFIVPDPSEVDHFIQCLLLFKKHGAVFQSVGYLGSECLIHSLIDHIDKVYYQLDDTIVEYEDLQVMAETFVGHIMQVLECLLQCGCQPDVCRYVQSDLHMMYYKLMSSSHLLPMALIRKAVLLMIHYGADPNIGSKHIPLCMVRLFVGRICWPFNPLIHLLSFIMAHQMPDRERDLLALFHIFYNNMEPSNARQCIMHFMQSDRYKNHSSKCPELDAFLVNLLSHPRSLQQLCASYVYVHMAKREARNLQRLNLPRSLKVMIRDSMY